MDNSDEIHWLPKSEVERTKIAQFLFSIKEMHSFNAVIFVALCLSMQAAAFLGFGSGDQYSVSIQGANDGVYAGKPLTLVATKTTKPNVKVDEIYNPSIRVYEDVRGRIGDRVKKLYPSTPITAGNDTILPFTLPYLEKDVRGVRFCLRYKSSGKISKHEYCDKTKYHRVDPPMATAAAVKSAPLPSRPAILDAPLSAADANARNPSLAQDSASLSHTPGPVTESFDAGTSSAIPANAGGLATGAALGSVSSLREASSLDDKAPVDEDAMQTVPEMSDVPATADENVVAPDADEVSAQDQDVDKAAASSVPEVTDEATDGSDPVTKEPTDKSEPATEVPPAVFPKRDSTLPIKTCDLFALTEKDVARALSTVSYTDILKNIKTSLGYQGLKLGFALTYSDLNFKLSQEPFDQFKKVASAKASPIRYGRAEKCERSHVVASGALAAKIDEMFGGRVEVLLGYIRNERQVVVTMISETYQGN